MGTTLYQTSKVSANRENRQTLPVTGMTHALDSILMLVKQLSAHMVMNSHLNQHKAIQPEYNLIRILYFSQVSFRGHQAMRRHRKQVQGKHPNRYTDATAYEIRDNRLQYQHLQRRSNSYVQIVNVTLSRIKEIRLWHSKQNKSLGDNFRFSKWRKYQDSVVNCGTLGWQKELIWCNRINLMQWKSEKLVL